MRHGGIVHHKLPPGTPISTRQPVNPMTGDDNPDLTHQEREEHALHELNKQIGNLARQIENVAFPVDEYNSAGVSGAASSASITVQPTYEYMPEKITSIIVTGPAGVVSLKLGDRIWPLTIPATGILVIAPLALMLGRSDDRILTPAVPGTYSLELMGYADRRFSA